MQMPSSCVGATRCEGKAVLPNYSLKVSGSRLHLLTGGKAAVRCGGGGKDDAASAAHLAWTSSGSGRQRGIERPTRATLQQESRTFLGHGAENGASILKVDHPSDYIGFGSLLDHGSLFRERFVIRFSEVTNGGTITLETLASLLQEAATNHVIAINFGFFHGSSNFDGSIVVTTRMHVEVDRYPAWRDLLEIDTWFQKEGKNSVRRDWIVKDVETGQQIAFATSTWVLMNSNTRRLVKMTDDKWAELEPHLRNPPKWALSEERRNSSGTRIAKLEDDVPYKETGLMALSKDCDMNQHVNNIRYIGFTVESVPEDVKSTHEVSKITLEYRQEASIGQAVDSLGASEEPTSRNTRQFTHLIKTSDVGKEINRGRSVWRPLGTGLQGPPVAGV